MIKGEASLWSRLALQIDLPTRIETLNSVHVDLGAGRKPRNPFRASQIIATDFSSLASRVVDGVHFVGCDLTKSLPFEDNSIDSISAFDLLEHIPRWERVNGQIEYPFINLMSEISRVLKKRGVFLAVTPAFPFQAAFQDPTHINFISENTIDYFVGGNPHASSIGYEFTGRFDLICQTWLRGAGPFVDFPLLENCTIRTKMGFLNYLRLGRRIAKLASTRKPTHLLWLLEKS